MIYIKLVYKVGAQARPGQSQAVIDGFGLAWGLTKPEPPQAKPKPGLSGQARPEQNTKFSFVSLHGPTLKFYNISCQCTYSSQ